MNNKKRPNLTIPLTWKDRILILIATVPIIFVIIYLKMDWNSIPEIIPTHFGFSGTPDAYGGKTSLFIIIGISAGLHVLMSILTKVPGSYNYPVTITEKNAEALYRIGRKIIILIDLEMSYMMSMLSWENIQTAMGRMQGVTSGILFLFIGSMFVTVIYGVIKMNKVKNL